MGQDFTFDDRGQKEEEKKDPIPSAGSPSASKVPGSTDADAINQRAQNPLAPDKSAESYKADMSAEAANPGSEGGNKRDISNQVSGPIAGGMRTTPTNNPVKPEGDIESLGPDDAETPAYIAGVRVRMNNKQRQDFENLHQKLNDAMGNRPIGDIPLNDPFHAVRKEFDAFVATLSR